jgi:hypothetical protein
VNSSEHGISAFVLGGFTGFSGIKMILTGFAGHKFTRAGFFNAFTGSFVSFDFRHWFSNK